MIDVEEASPPRANYGNRRTRTNIQPPNSNNRRRDKKRYVHAFFAVTLKKESFGPSYSYFLHS